ncbi:MAG TPA: 6-bladed beta-propeller [Draconibacterium sp.]|nr:6-bladed beta-propeller [Draconibacterium sp.]
MKQYVYFILFLFVFFISCNRNQVINNDLPVILLDNSNDILPISSFIEDLDYLELKVTEAGIELGDILDVKVLNGDYIIYQRRANEIGFLRFNQSGDFLNTVVSNKRGSGKIKNPLDIIIYNKDYAVLAEDGIYIVAKDGEYKTKLIAAQMPGSKFFQSNNKFYVLNEVPDNGLYTIYAQHEKTEKITFPEDRLREMGKSNLIEYGKNDIRLISSYSDTIFSFEKNEFTPESRIESSEEYPSFAKVWRNTKGKETLETLKYIHNTHHTKIKTYLENDSYIFLTYWLGSYQTSALIKKDTWTTLYFSQAVNNLDGGIWNTPSYLSDNNNLLIPITAYKVSGHIISDKRHREFEKVQLHIAASGNPVIMRCSLK